MLRTGGRCLIGGPVNPNAALKIDGNTILHKMITLQGVHNYHSRQLIMTLGFVMTNREPYPFAKVVDLKFALDQLGEAFARTTDCSVFQAANVP